MANKAIVAARAAIRDVEARIAAHKEVKAAEQALAETARQKLTRLSAPATVQRQGFRVELTDTLKIRPSYYSGDGKKLAEALLSGEVKIDYGAGTSRGVKSLATILRLTAKADMRALARLTKRISALETQRAELIAAMHERGTRLSPEQVASHAVKVWTTSKAIPHSAGWDDWELRRMETELTNANTHLEFITGKLASPVSWRGKPVCPCPSCADDRRRQEAAEAEAERLATLPKVKVKACPCGKAHIVPLDRRRSRVTLDGQEVIRDNAPVFRCPVSGTLYVHDGILRRELAFEAKAAERQLRREGVDWECPGCGENRRTVVERDDYGEPFVECPTCERGYGLGSVNPRAFVRWSKQHEEDAA